MSYTDKPIADRNEPPLFKANDPGVALAAAEAARRAEFAAAAEAGQQNLPLENE